MSDHETLLQNLSRPFPDAAIEQRQGGGGRMLSYVATETVIRRLNNVAKTWDFRITDKMIQGTVLIVWGELTIPGLGTRAGTGVQVIPDRPGAEDMWKGAASDCLKKCATTFGVGIDLYGPDLEAGELANTERTRGPQLPPRGRTTSENTVPETGEIVGWTEFWRYVEAEGLPRDKKALETAMGTTLGANPAYALERFQAWRKDVAEAEQGVLV